MTLKYNSIELNIGKKPDKLKGNINKEVSERDKDFLRRHLRKSGLDEETIEKMVIEKTKNQ